MTKRAHLSVVLVTHNEEEIIKDCLESIKFADEIVVVDTESIDKTVEISRNYTAKIIITTNKPNPNVNMNIGFEATTGEWILLIAPDERVTAELQKEILFVINSPGTKEGYYMPRKNYFLGKWLKHGGHYPDWQLRLFRKNKGRFPEKSVHESLQVEGKVDYLKNPLIHYSYPNLNELLRKIDLYSRGDFKFLKEKGWKIKPGNYFWFFILRPFLVFCQKYFLKLGFLDGVEGFIFAASSAYADFYRSAYFWNKSQKKENSQKKEAD